MGGGSPFSESPGASGSFNGRTTISLWRDIVRAGHGRGYRSHCLYASPFLLKNETALSVCDVLRPGGGDTTLRINILGDLELGKRGGFVDVLAATGHMGWLQSSNETIPSVWDSWVGAPADFTSIYPFQEIVTLFDLDR